VNPGTRIRMSDCVGREPVPPIGAGEEYAAQGGSLRPVQEHIGDYGVVLWTDGDGVAVRFDDGDERKLFLLEIEVQEGEPQ